MKITRRKEADKMEKKDDFKATMKGVALFGTVYGIITAAMVVASHYPQVFTY